MKCPQCSHELETQIFSEVPQSQTFALKLEYNGEYVVADAVSKALTAMSTLYKGVAKNHGSKVELYVSKLDLSPGKLEIRFVCATIK